MLFMIDCVCMYDGMDVLLLPFQAYMHHACMYETDWLNAHTHSSILKIFHLFDRATM